MATSLGTTHANTERCRRAVEGWVDHRCHHGGMEIWHLALARDWETAGAAGAYRVSTLGATLDDVGYIHCSRPDQAPGVAARFYADISDPLAILVMDDDALR